MRVGALVILLGLAQLARAAPGADEHVLAGARLFRAQRYGEALVEFRVAQRLGDADAAGYAAATLVKLDRAEEAIEAFAALKAAGAPADPLLDYYQALACHQLGLYLCADRLLASVGDRSGPRIGAQARKIRADIAPLLTAQPSAENVDRDHQLGARAAAAGRRALAAAYYREAAALAERRGDGRRRAEALAALARLGTEPPERGR